MKQCFYPCLLAILLGPRAREVGPNQFLDPDSPCFVLKDFDKGEVKFYGPWHNEAEKGITSLVNRAWESGDILESIRRVKAIYKSPPWSDLNMWPVWRDYVVQQLRKKPVTPDIEK